MTTVILPQAPPCGWVPLYPDCDGTGASKPAPLSSMPASGVALYEQTAAEYLWRWTGEKLGVCTISIALCRESCWEGQSTYFGSGPVPSYGGLWRPVIIGGQWWNIGGCGFCRDKCGCSSGDTVTIPGPVQAITSVAVSGVALPSTSYRVDNWNMLVRLDGQTWPECGTQVTYDRGAVVPTGLRIAQGILANELAKAVCNDKSCALPQRVQSITRQGVTIAMIDNFQDVEKGYTGIWAIDSQIASINKAPRRSRVFSPDISKIVARQTTWPLGSTAPGSPGGGFGY